MFGLQKLNMLEKSRKINVQNKLIYLVWEKKILSLDLTSTDTSEKL